MEVPIVISVDMVKPTARQFLDDAVPPFKLCLIDQLASRHYFGAVLFYGANQVLNKNDTTKLLKATLSKALNSFYPLSGRVKQNLTVEEFQTGVPFTETRVDNRLSDFLRNPSLAFINHLFPLEPSCLISTTTTTTSDDGQPSLPPLLLVQVNVFGCGGIAIGLSFNHKISDGATADIFLKHWTLLCSSTTAEGDGFVEMSQQGSSVFPPRELIPSEVLSIADDWFQDDRNSSTKRFVFDANAVAELKSSSKSIQVDNPTRNEAISAFIWRSVIRAATSAATKSSPPPQLLVQPVNIRRRMNLSDTSFGNLLSTAATSYPQGQITTTTTTSDLVQLMRADVARVDQKSILAVSRDEGFEAMVEGWKQFRELGQQVLTCSSWIRFFSDADFGWGKPAWTSVLGEASGNYPTCGNLVILTENNSSNGGDGGIEACIRLDVDVMDVLQQDSEFLEFASLNPPIALILD